MVRSSSLALCSLLLAAAALSGCSPGPDPAPTPTPAFASEEEAFAAAEETYRAYNNAVNAERLQQSEISPREFLVGKALDGDTVARQTLQARGLTVVGDGVITKLASDSIQMDANSLRLNLLLCLDVGATRVLDANGSDVTPVDRAPQIALNVEFVVSDDVLLISDSTTSEAIEC